MSISSSPDHAQHAPSEFARQIPDTSHRWRCGGCGNLTRFDVVRSARTREFWHVDLAGNAVVEESESLRVEVESIACRWCGRTDQIEVVERPTATADQVSQAPAETT